MPEAVVATSPALLLPWVERDTNATLVEVNGGGHHPVTAVVVVNPQLEPSTVNIRADRKNGDPGPVANWPGKQNKARNPWIPDLALVRGGGLEPPPPFED